MKLRNKKTGEIVDLVEIVRLDDVSNEFYLRLSDNEGRTFKVGFNSLAELNTEWEDVPEEPKDKGYWYIDDLCRMRYSSELLDEIGDRPNNWMIRKLCCNYFSSREEAELAVRKLKAWKRLKDNGFRFDGKTLDTAKRFGSIFYWLDENAYSEDYIHDLNLLFGGEE